MEDLSKLSDAEIDARINKLGQRNKKSPQEMTDKELDDALSYQIMNMEPPKDAPKTDQKSGGFVKGAFESAPMTLGTGGAMIGGLASGIPTLGVGSVPGALMGGGLGSVLGSAIRSLGRKYVYDQPETRGEYYGNLAKEGILGTTSEMGGQIVGRGLSAAGKGLAGLFEKKPGAELIEQAASRLGTKATPGMTAASPTLSGLESSLQQSPTLGGSLARSKSEPVRKAIEQTVESITKEGTSLSPYELGEKAKSGMIAEVGQKTGPVSMLFETVKEATKDIPLDQKSLSRVSKNIQKIDEVRLMPKESWSTKANSYAEALTNAQSVDEIATIRKVVGQDMRAAQGNERAVLGKIYDKLSKLENNQLVKGAIGAAKNQKEGAKIGKEIVGESLEARKLWKGLIQDLNQFSKASGMKKEGIAPILNAIEDIPSEKVSQKFFNTGNFESLKQMQRQFPEQFEILRKGKLTEIQKAATDSRGEVNPSMFLREIKSMGPEVRELVFGKGSKQIISDLETVVRSLPEKMGPSGTPQGLDFSNILNPWIQLRDAARYGVLKGQGPLRAAGEKLQSPMVQPTANIMTRRLLELNQNQGR